MAVFGIGCGGCAWYLVLLALVPIMTSAASVTPPPVCKYWWEFHKRAENLTNTFASCPSDCNATHIDRKCQCLNINVSESCVFPEYHISGLRALNNMVPESATVIYLTVSKLTAVHKRCKDFINFVPRNCLPSVSPQSFCNKLISDAQQFFTGLQVHK